MKSLSLRGRWEKNLFGYLANRPRRLDVDYILPELRSVLIQGDPFPCRAFKHDFGAQDRRLDCRVLLETAPKLQTLELYGMGRHEEPIMDTAAVNLLRQPLPTHLRNIRFLNSVFIANEDRKLFLKPFIEHCAALERFTMQLRACICLTYLSNKRLVSPGDLVDMLETQKNSLKYLDLNYLDPHDVLYYPDDDSDGDFDDDSDDDSGNDFNDATPAGQITTNVWSASPNLATFPVLEELHIDEQSFCHHWQTQSHVEAEDVPRTCLTDIVPQSIQRLLVLVRPKSRAWEDVQHFSNEVARGRYTNLQRMKLVLHFSDYQIPDFLWAPNEVPHATIFIAEARAIKQLLEASKVVFRAGVLAGDPRDSVTPVFRSLSDDLEELLGIETLELPFNYQKDDEWHELCSY